MKKLGWANIDRLFNDSRTEQIELVVNVVGHEDYDNIYTSMIFKKQGMYLPGYQKKDQSFSFTHGDYEKTALPVGEVATVLITAYKDGIPFLGSETFTIKQEQSFDLELTATSVEGLKKELEKRV